jgi:hypothetical protein
MAAILNPNAGPDEPLRIDLEAEPPAEGNDTTATPASAEGATATTPPPPPAVGIEELNRQLTESKAQREAAVAAAQQAQQQRDYATAVAAEAQRRGISTEELMNDQAITNIQERAASLKTEAKTAHEVGDYGRVADINFELGRLGGALNAHEQHKWRLQQQREQFVATQQQAARQPPPPSDPFERALVGRTSRTQDFLRSHKDLVRSDGTLKRAAVDAHERALDEGHAVDTDAYFQRIEELVAEPAPAERKREVKNPPPERRAPPPMAAAPVSRGTSRATGGTEFIMTPHMRRLAEEQLGPGHEVEWFENYQRAVREGRMEPLS